MDMGTSVQGFASALSLRGGPYGGNVDARVEQCLTKIAHLQLAISNRSIATVMAPLRRRMLDDIKIRDI
jgi:hypothetical protein